MYVIIHLLQGAKHARRELIEIETPSLRSEHVSMVMIQNALKEIGSSFRFLCLSSCLFHLSRIWIDDYLFVIYTFNIHFLDMWQNVNVTMLMMMMMFVGRTYLSFEQRYRFYREETQTSFTLFELSKTSTVLYLIAIGTLFHTKSSF